ncbi:MAG: DUF433 domain-containing protein [Dehalococcoidia bacterium]|nr:DUF433 domain-containing protein [Dehalococcoidia bacterium]
MDSPEPLKSEGEVTFPAARPPAPLTRPLYSYADADYLAGVGRGTSKRWLEGYSYRRGRGQRVKMPPVTPGEMRPTGVSFVDFIEIIAIGRLRTIGLTLNDVRTVVVRCQQEFQVQHPLASLKFKVGGRDTFVERDGVLHDVLRRPKGHVAWDEILNPFLETLDYQGAYAHRWWPLGRDGLVVIDPEYAFGLPVIANSGVRTEIILERIRAGETDEQIASDFNVSRPEIHEAMKFELIRSA